MAEALHFEEQTLGDVVVLILQGRFDATAALPVKNRIRSLMDEESRYFVVDLGKVSFIDSSGLGALVAALRHVTNSDGDLRLANMTDKIQQVFSLIRLDKVFNVYPDVASAVTSFEE
ncbi:anti-sigma factor antagonist [Pseudodesulfovibrio sp. JC047]|uniref:STAS domain-containing protein n=1 Tax=Pseudodesulfovibrio sp. JC047 TaxID=2683199 RepID=UPI0013D6A845|nr:STAS domain-containing protein [Pseudodesulfovibrio sp. JC047]NDV19270.1 anti-sigma factor antagonist [Pseudodesulfovibrio sp. JC047]